MATADECVYKFEVDIFITDEVMTVIENHFSRDFGT